MTDDLDITRPLMTRSGKPVYNVRRVSSGNISGNILGLILDRGTEEWHPDGTHIHNRTGNPHKNDLVPRQENAE